ncbi:MAG: archaellin/type IV pilin N-terminal domain-containing protein [Candidatus Bathyarchaeia archaeon]
MNAKTRHKRKAISPLIATLILIAIITVGGILVYTSFLSIYSILISRGQIVIEAIDLVQQTDGSVTFTITVKNAGNKPVTGLTVNLAGNDLTYLAFSPDPALAPLQPGQATSGILTELSGYAGGTSYNIVVRAVFRDGSTYSVSHILKCRGSGIVTGRSGGFTYFGYWGSAKIVKVDTSTFTIKKTSSDLGYGDMYCCISDGSYLYIVGWKGTAYHLGKISPENLEIISEKDLSGFVNDPVYGGGVSNGYAYILDSGGTLVKIKVSDLSIVASTNITNYYPVVAVLRSFCLDEKGEYLYVTAWRPSEWSSVMKVRTSDLTIIGDYRHAQIEAADYLTLSRGYVYTHSGKFGRVFKINTSTLSLEGTVTLSQQNTPGIELTVSSSKLYLTGVWIQSGNYIFHRARINLDTFTLENEKVTQTPQEAGGPRVGWPAPQAYADNNHIYRLLWMPDGSYIVRIETANLEVTERLGPLSP